MRKRGSNDGEFKPIAHVRDTPFHSLPQHRCTLLLVGFVLGASWFEFLPRFIRFAARRVHMNHVLAVRAQRLVQKTGDKETAKILGVLERSTPILDNEMSRVLNV
jgi:hypothetical protein